MEIVQVSGSHGCSCKRGPSIADTSYFLSYSRRPPVCRDTVYSRYDHSGQVVANRVLIFVLVKSDVFCHVMDVSSMFLCINHVQKQEMGSLQQHNTTFSALNSK